MPYYIDKRLFSCEVIPLFEMLFHPIQHPLHHIRE
jgi:hypothetical protein